jgi:hypothetical protein
MYEPETHPETRNPKPETERLLIIMTYAVFLAARTQGFVHSPLLKQTGITYQPLLHVSDWCKPLVSAAPSRKFGQLQPL